MRVETKAYDDNGETREYRVLAFDRTADVHRWCEDRVRDEGGRLTTCERGAFYGGESFASANAKAQQAHQDLGERVRKVISEIADLDVHTTRKQRVRSVAGRACVPAALAGSPKPMRRQTTGRDVTAPITIVSDVTSSGAIPDDDLVNHGIYLAACVAKLAQTRPVRLVWFTLGGPDAGYEAYGAYYPVQTTPLQIPRAVYMLAGAGFTRAVGHGMIEAATHDGAEVGRSQYISWPHDDGTWYEKDHGKQFLRDTFGANVLYLGPKVSSNPDWRAYRENPLAWLETLMKRAKEMVR